MLLELRRAMERQHADVMVEIRRLGRYQRDKHESLPALLRRMTEIERVLKLTEMHVLPGGHTRRRPLRTP